MRCSMINRLCKIIGSCIPLLYEAILHLVSLTSIQLLSLEFFLRIFFLDQPFYCILLIMEGLNRDTFCQIANFKRKTCCQREIIHGGAFFPRWHPSPSLPFNLICRGHCISLSQERRWNTLKTDQTSRGCHQRETQEEKIATTLATGRYDTFK